MELILALVCMIVALPHAILLSISAVLLIILKMKIYPLLNFNKIEQFLLSATESKPPNLYVAARV
jgi:hypothetical protein